MRVALVTVLCLVACGRGGEGGTAMPDPGHAWSDDEVVLAADAIARHPEQLPPYPSEVLTRLTEPPPPPPEGTAIQIELGGRLKRMGGMDTLAHLYMRYGTARAYAALLASMLREQPALFHLSDRFMASLGPAANEPVRRDGLRQMRDGTYAMMLGALVMAQQSKDPDVGHTLLRSLAIAAPGLLPRLTADQRRALLEPISAAASADGPLRDDFAAVLAAASAP